jgi:DNA replicative helicase MCM subunit Mcm2 (Cdc46/Mcm family)
MNKVVKFRIPVSGATTEDADEAMGIIKQTFKELKVRITNSILDAQTEIIGVSANFKENSPVGVRIDDIKRRMDEGKDELFKVLDDLCGDIVGRIQNADDLQQIFGEE